MKDPKTARAPQDAEKYVVRMPPGLRETLKNAAAANGRSLNAEIILRLSSGQSPPQDVVSTIPSDALIRELLERFKPASVEIRIGRLSDDSSET